MGKRLTRIFEAQIQTHLPKLLGQEIHLILKNNVTLHGIILKIETQHIVFKDMILRKHTIPIAELSQILKDEKSDW